MVCGYDSSQAHDVPAPWLPASATWFRSAEQARNLVRYPTSSSPMGKHNTETLEITVNFPVRGRFENDLPREIYAKLAALPTIGLRSRFGMMLICSCNTLYNTLFHDTQVQSREEILYSSRAAHHDYSFQSCLLSLFWPYPFG